MNFYLVGLLQGAIVGTALGVCIYWVCCWLADRKTRKEMSRRIK